MSKLVIGYVPGVDVLSEEARRWGLDRRVAFVFETFRPDKVDLYFDAGLYAALVESVRESRARGRGMGGRTPRGEVRLRPGELSRLLEQTPEVEQEPLARIRLTRGAAAVALIASEPWVQVGGPEPDHDSYTVLAYRGRAWGRSWRRPRAACARARAELTEVICASEQPLSPGYLARAKSLLAL